MEKEIQTAKLDVITLRDEFLLENPEYRESISDKFAIKKKEQSPSP